MAADIILDWCVKGSPMSTSKTALSSTLLLPSRILFSWAHHLSLQTDCSQTCWMVCSSLLFLASVTHFHPGLGCTAPRKGKGFRFFKGGSALKHPAEYSPAPQLTLSPMTPTPSSLGNDFQPSAPKTPTPSGITNKCPRTSRSNLPSATVSNVSVHL